MKSKFITSVVLASMMAFGAQADDFTGSLYIEDAVIAPGGKTELSLQLTNNLEIQGFQFEMTLPDGVTVVNQSLSEGRMPTGAEQLSSKSVNGSYFKWACTLNGNDKPSFVGNSGEIATITIAADASAVEGEYEVTLSGIDVADNSGKDHDVDPYTFKLKIGALTYAEGYTVEILPFAFKEDVEVPFVMDNLTDITNIAFDVQLPAAFFTKELYYIDNALVKTKFNTSDASSADGTVHVTVESKSDNKVAAGSGTDVAVLGLAYNASAVPAGVYTVSIKNISLTDTNGDVYLAAPYSTEIFVGTSPKISVTDGVAAFHGNYGGATEYALLTAALPEGATIDLTEVSATAEDPTALKSDNVIVTQDAVAYGRTVSSEWGSLCLPFAVESDDNIQLYEFTGASSTALIFTKIASAEADTPLIFKATGDGFSVKQANDGTFDPGFAIGNPSVEKEQSVANWVFMGAYVTETVDTEKIQAYALSGGEFHKVTSKLDAKAFHAWLKNNGSALGANLRIVDGTEAIDIVEQEDGSVKLIYDLQGRRQKTGQHNQLIIENGEKKYNK